jgi:hypothetical protein
MQLPVKMCAAIDTVGVYNYEDPIMQARTSNENDYFVAAQKWTGPNIRKGKEREKKREKKRGIYTQRTKQLASADMNPRGYMWLLNDGQKQETTLNNN